MSVSFVLVTGVMIAVCATSFAAQPQATQPADAVHYRRVSITDPQMQNAEACTLLAPADWKVDGGIVWDIQQISYPATVNIRVSNPAGDRRVSFFPAMHFVWLYSPMAQQWRPRGSRYMGSQVEPTIADCRTALARVAWPASHGNIAGAKITDFKDLPDFAKVAGANLPQLPGVTYDVHAGKMRVAYNDPQNGVAMEEDLIGVLTVARCPQLQSDGWHIDKLISYTAPAGQLDQAEKEMETIPMSFRLNPNWFAGMLQAQQSLMAINNQANNVLIQQNMIHIQAITQISEQQRAAFQRQQDVATQSNEAFDRTIRGVDLYQNTDGSQVELPNTYTHAWSNGAGDYIVSNNALYNPNANQQGSWSQLQQAGG